jgi:nicotinamide mononucleotide transporter
MESYLAYATLVTGVFYVILASRNNIWCWLFGIISSALQIYINLDKHLYQDAILQTYYIGVGFYGWWVWGQKFGPEQELPIVSWSLPQNLKVIALGCVLFPIFGYLFSLIGNSLSYIDAAVTVFSFIATWMTTKKILQNWLYWIVIDLVAGIMYVIKDVNALTILYLIFVPLAIYGYLEWQKKLKAA